MIYNQTVTNLIYIAVIAGLLILEHYGLIPADIVTAIVGLLGLHIGGLTQPTPVTTPTDAPTTVSTVVPVLTDTKG